MYHQKDEFSFTGSIIIIHIPEECYIQFIALNILLQDLGLYLPEQCGLGKRKRSFDMRQRRYNNINFPNVNINQSIAMMINDILLPAVMNVSLNSGEWL